MPSGFDESWTKQRPDCPLTESLIEEVGELLGDLIEKNNGEWTGTIHKDILPKLGKEDKWYATVWAAMMEARKKYNIGYDKVGRNGGRYYLQINKNSKTNTEENNNFIMAKDKLKQAKKLINSINLENINDTEAISLLNVLTMILK